MAVVAVSFSRQYKPMDTRILDLTGGRLTEALDAVYQTFQTAPPTVIVGCPCCIASRGTDVLLSTPLRSIPSLALWRYVSGLFLTVGAERDFRYLLPRILEVSVFEPGNANDAEIVLGKLALAEWRIWAQYEQRVVEAFIDAWFDHALASDLAQADDGCIGWDTESVLCGAARAGMSLAPWLARLAAPSVAPVVASLQERLPCAPSGFWEGAPEALHQLRAFLGQR